MKKGTAGIVLTIIAVIILAVVVSGAGMLPDPNKLMDDLFRPKTSEQEASEGTQRAASNSYRETENHTNVISETPNPSVDLTSLEPYYDGSIQIERNGLTDTLGNKYRSGLRGYMAPGDPQKYNLDCYCIWDIGGRFRTLTATGIIRKQDKGSQYEGSYRIYGDGRLLYSRDGIDSMTKPYQISIDITGVTDLKIEMYGNGNAGTSGINSVLADIMLLP